MNYYEIELQRPKTGKAYIAYDGQERLATKFSIRAPKKEEPGPVYSNPPIELEVEQAYDDQLNSFKAYVFPLSECIVIADEGWGEGVPLPEKELVMEDVERQVDEIFLESGWISTTNPGTHRISEKIEPKKDFSTGREDESDSHLDDLLG